MRCCTLRAALTFYVKYCGLLSDLVSGTPSLLVCLQWLAFHVYYLVKKNCIHLEFVATVGFCCFLTGSFLSE